MARATPRRRGPLFWIVAALLLAAAPFAGYWMLKGFHRLGEMRGASLAVTAAPT